MNDRIREDAVSSQKTCKAFIHNLRGSEIQSFSEMNPQGRLNINCVRQGI